MIDISYNYFELGDLALLGPSLMNPRLFCSYCYSGEFINPKLLTLLWYFWKLLKLLNFYYSTLEPYWFSSNSLSLVNLSEKLYYYPLKFWEEAEAIYFFPKDSLINLPVDWSSEFFVKGLLKFFEFGYKNNLLLFS